MAQMTLVLGGARSGKSAFAERLARAEGERIVYVATAKGGDAEMAERIRRHRERRPASWTTVLAPLDPAAELEILPGAWDCVLLDSVAFWMSNLLLRALPDVRALGDEFPTEMSKRLERDALTATRRLLDWHAKQSTALVVVSDEVGLSVVPAFASGRAYRDLLGTVNQALAAAADAAYLVVAGLPVQIKGGAVRGADVRGAVG